MIVSASYRTDIPAFYADWFRNRLADGFAEVKNPYGGKSYRVSLASQEVDGFVFWTRNVAPFEGVLEDLQTNGQAFVVQFTMTGYPRSIDVSTISVDHAAQQMMRLSRTFGGKTVVWRYDPILITAEMTFDWHVENFRHLASRLNGVVDEVTVSFANFYEKTISNLRAGPRLDAVSWQDPPSEEKSSLLAILSGIAQEQGMWLSLCTQPLLLTDRVREARCIDVHRLSIVADREILAKQKGNREGCACAESRDIGAYDTCPHGCRYCYAVRSPAGAKERYSLHDPARSRL